MLLVSADGSATYWAAGKAIRQALRADPNTLEMLFLPSATPQDPIGDPNAHAEPLSEVRHLLALEVVAVRANNATYIDPLQYVTVWERTDQGVDAQLPVGAPILAPCRIKVLAVEPDWYAGQPLVYFELLDGPDAGKVQYVAEEITDIARPGSILEQGQAIARYASPSPCWYSRTRGANPAGSTLVLERTDPPDPSSTTRPARVSRTEPSVRAKNRYVPGAWTRSTPV